MAKVTFWVICLVLALFLLSCRGGSSETTPQAEPSTPGVPTATADSEPDTATPGAPSGFQHLEGETMAFDYPSDWNVWSKTFNETAERIVIANIPVQPETDQLPAGGIKIAFESPGSSGPTLSPVEPLEIVTAGAEKIPFGVFEGGSGAVARWSLRAMVDKGERVYYAFAEVNTEESAPDVLKSILGTWTFKP